jgi:hypothetical protein
MFGQKLSSSEADATQMRQSVWWPRTHMRFSLASPEAQPPVAYLQNVCFLGKILAMAPSGFRIKRWCGSRGPGEGHLGKIGLMRRVVAMKAELMGESSSPLEKLPAGRMAADGLLR